MVRRLMQIMNSEDIEKLELGQLGEPMVGVRSKLVSGKLLLSVSAHNLSLQSPAYFGATHFKYSTQFNEDVCTFVFYGVKGGEKR